MTNIIDQGFGVTARSTMDMKKLQPTDIIVFHQADVGEYLRAEDTLFQIFTCILYKRNKKK